MPPGGRAISDNPKIIASFTLHISINFFHKQVLISRPHHLQKPFWVWFFKSALYGIGLPRGIYSLFGRKSAHFRNKQLPPFAKRHPVFTLHGKDFALKLDSFPTICNTMLHSTALLVAGVSSKIGRWIPDICTAPKCFKNFNWKNRLDTRCFNLGSNYTDSWRKKSWVLSEVQNPGVTVQVPEQMSEWDFFVKCLVGEKLVWYVKSYN